MSAEAVAEVIQLVIAPTVMISGCTTINNGILSRYSLISNRLRSLNRERTELLINQDVPTDVADEAIYLIDQQLRSLSRRHLLLQRASLIHYGAMILFMGSMLLISLTKVFLITQLSNLALLLFFLGTMSLVFGIILAGSEMQISHQAIRFETNWVMSLAKPTSSPPGSPKPPGLKTPRRRTDSTRMNYLSIVHAHSE